MAPASPDKDGFWGTRTSTLDWCEENYVVTPYIAEFWNTISNIVMIIPPAICALHFWKKGLETRHILSGISLLAVGIGSWFFHMTLLYEMQLLDELPMIYGSCVFLYALNHHSRKPDDWSKSMIFYLITFSAFVTSVYLYCKNPVFHQVCYAFLVFYLIYEAYRAILNHPEIVPWAALSLGTYATGFIVWNIDNNLCPSLRHARANVLHHAVTPVTQLHAWWHLFTGFGTYLHILVSAYARTLHLKRECAIKVRWKPFDKTYSSFNSNECSTNGYLFQMAGGVFPYLHVGEKV